MGNRRKDGVNVIILKDLSSQGVFIRAPVHQHSAENIKYYVSTAVTTLPFAKVAMLLMSLIKMCQASNTSRFLFSFKAST